MNRKVEAELISVSKDWDQAMVTNDADAIGAFMADDWIIIGSDGNICDKATFLGLVKSGALTHDVMESHDMNVRVYGDTAVVVGRGVSGGKYQGQPFREVERVTCVFVRQQGQWRCVLTHLSRIAQPDA
jgi:ketosteroid isomerase-like protein